MAPENLGFGDVERVFDELRRGAGGGPYRNRNHRDDSHLEAIADAANGAGSTRTSREEALRVMVSAFLADAKAREEGAPVGWLARDPGRYLVGRRTGLSDASAVSMTPEKQALADAIAARESDPSNPELAERVMRARRVVAHSERPS